MIILCHFLFWFRFSFTLVFVIDFSLADCRWWNCNMIFLLFLYFFISSDIDKTSERGDEEVSLQNPFPHWYNWWLQRLENPVRFFPNDNLLLMRQKGNWICKLTMLTISDVSLINYRSRFIPITDTWRNSDENKTFG